jgi:mono/diheme cytochrome c family protein
MSKFYFWAIGVLAFTAAVLAQNTPNRFGYQDQAQIEQRGSVLNIVANDPRPLAQTFDGLAKRFGWNLSYEDPQFVAPGDAKLIPSGGAFSVSLSDFNLSEPKNKFRVLDGVIKAYNNSTNPGRFELRGFDDGSYVAVGVAAANGPQTPIMDTKITLKTGVVSGDDALDMWGHELTRVSGIHVEATTGVAENSMIQARVTIDAENVSARDALRQIIKAVGSNRRWLLYYDHMEKLYVLNFVYRENREAVAVSPANQSGAAAPQLPDKSLIAQGKARYLYYKCDECHGATGKEGGDGPELAGTLMSAEEISKFLVKPSPDAYMKGMPDIPLTNPDHQALVAYVLSLKRPPN